VTDDNREPGAMKQWPWIVFSALVGIGWAVLLGVL
jgi:hypothetical protein